MKVTATTFPRSSLRESRWPSWVVKLTSGAGPILGKLSCSPVAWLRVGASQLTTASIMSIPMPHPCRPYTPLPSHLGCFSPVPRSPHPLSTLSLHLLLQLLEETPVGALGDDLLGA